MSERKEIAWSQIYRPRTIEDCILPQRLKTSFQKYVNDGAVPSLTLTGTPGVGKTTVAKAMLEQIGCDYLVINGSSDNGIGILRTRMTNYATSLSMNGRRKVIIIDEADYLTPECQAAMRGVIEDVSDNCSFILTCNFKSKLIPALHSRAPIIEFRLVNEERPAMAQELLGRIKDILTKEKVTWTDDSVLIEVIMKYFPDYRKILNTLQHHAAQCNNVITTEILSDGVGGNIQEVLGYMKDKHFRKLRQWVAKYSDDPTQVYRMLYEVADTKFTPNTFPDAILIIADNLQKSAFSADQEITMIGCFVELMTRCELR